MRVEPDDKAKALSDQILGDARKKADRLVKKAGREAAQMIEDAEKEGEKIANGLVAETEKEAQAEYRRLTAGIPSMKARKILAGEEKILESAIEEAISQLRKRFDSDPARHMRSLTLGAALEMPEDEILIETCERDRGIFNPEFINDIAAEIKRREGRDVRFELSQNSPGISGGVILRAKSGKTLYDNSFEARVSRLREDLRVKAAKILFPDG